MKEIHIDYTAHDLNYPRACILAMNAAHQHQMREPTIMAWHGGAAMSPAFEGGDPQTWWEKYGEGNGGSLEISVGEKDDYTFIVMDTKGYETVGPIPLRNLSDEAGLQYVCYTPLLGGNDRPNTKACSVLDDWMADQY